MFCLNVVKVMNKNKKGFTLLEILLAVAALVILAGIVILAINPNKQLADARNSQRWVDVNTILNAVYQHSIDNEGVIPVDIVATEKEICRIGFDETDDCEISLETELIPEYLVSMPVDPRETNLESTGYVISTTTTANRIKVSAPNAERGQVIEVIR
jgi:prepilin-type N-terminal cleavage/methylation domain-containing protein